MSVSYNNLHVDEAYASQIEANLYYNPILVPGVTCDDSFETGPAGGIYVHKLSTSAITPTAPGNDFSDVAAADSLISIIMNNRFATSKKIYNVQAAAMAADVKSEELAIAQAECREGWMLSGLACLAHEATSGTATGTTAKKKLINARKAIVEAKGHADVVICSPTFYANILEEAGSEFTPIANDRIVDSGNVGRWLGMTIIEASGMVSSTAKYYDYTGTLQTVDLSALSFIMYAHETLSVVSNMDMARVVDSENFNGCKAQVELNTGYRVRNAALALAV